MDLAASGPRDRARQREGEHGADDVEGGGRRWWRGVMNPVARRDRRGGVEAEGGVGADDVEAAARRDAMEAEEIVPEENIIFS
ncbi:hypothetical protein OsJ_08383 [Oryza sativa Japonica Group]|uniref:Uncharacterized protein n=1 Tax=Oryza sativa subsp. japonica TaxID=39947 RepID=B9F2Z9_ORYSJ|nr:hypothetical protein OsJ_08383 [Oryza sativa Japonica Group]